MGKTNQKLMCLSTCRIQGQQTSHIITKREHYPKSIQPIGYTNLFVFFGAIALSKIEEGFPEAPPRAIERRKNENTFQLLSLLVIFISRSEAFSGPFLL
jgi:hypothetical protein